METYITNKVKLIKDSIKKDIPYKITFNNYLYTLSDVNPLERKKNTWYCQNYRKKNLPINIINFVT